MYYFFINLYITRVQETLIFIFIALGGTFISEFRNATSIYNTKACIRNVSSWNIFLGTTLTKWRLQFEKGFSALLML